MAPVPNPAELPAPATCVSWYRSAGSSAPSAPASMHQRPDPCTLVLVALPGSTPGACQAHPGPDRRCAASQAGISTSPHSPHGTSTHAEPRDPTAATVSA